MKKILIFASLVPVLLIAGISHAHAEPAVIATGFGCSGLDGNGASIFTVNSKVVITNSHNGVVNFKCHFSDVDNDTGKAVHWDFDNTGTSCSTTAGITTDWKMVVDTEGFAQLTCKVHPNS